MQLMANCHGATMGTRCGARTRPVGPVLLGLVAISALLSSGPSQALAADAASSRTSAAADLFARFCSQCHGLNGRGEAGRVNAPAIPDFTSRAWQQSRSNVQLTVSILEGKNQQMPANRGLVSDELARELVAHVRKFAPTPSPRRSRGRQTRAGRPRTLSLVERTSISRGARPGPGRPRPQPIPPPAISRSISTTWRSSSSFTNARRRN